jgi:Protein kinase domain
MSLVGGQVFAGYTIVRVLGSGGMGSVYLASHPRLPRQDALKVLPPDLTADAEFRARFLREAELAAGLSHPNIVGIHDRGEEDGQFWISMDYVAGTDAGHFLREHYPGGMPLEEVAPIIAAVGSALDYAHHRGLLHRDVKPANILLADPDGQERRAFLADFGIARSIDDAAGLTATNMTVGTVNYAAPEQLRGEPIDARADQYALACTAFHLLAGVAPFDDSNPAVVISRHVKAPPPSIGARRPELAGLDAVFATPMAKQPSRRFGSCAEFASHLAQQPNQGFAYPDAIPFPDTQPSLDVTAPALPTPPAPPAAKPRRPGVLIGALLGTALLIAGGVFAAVKLTQHHHPGAAPRPPGGTAPTPNTGPFTGVYQVHFGPATKLDGAVVAGQKPLADTYAVRSVCRPAGCVATATRLSGEMRLASSTIFDQVGGRWVAVTLASDKCRDALDEIWQVLTLEPRPDGTFTGNYRGAAANACAEKRTVTFTRTGDVDVNSLPDPSNLPARVASPAEALHGRYHMTRKFANGAPSNQDGPAVITDCLRTGDRCMSYFHSGSFDTPMVFSGGNWNMNVEHDEDAPNCGGQVGVKITGQYPLPQPPQMPITLLAGHGHLSENGSAPCDVNVDFDETYTRIGD